MNIKQIKIADIIDRYKHCKPDPNLVKHVKEYGLFQPIVVVKLYKQTKYHLLDGQLRLTACKQVRLKTIKAYVYHRKHLPHQIRGRF